MHFIRLKYIERHFYLPEENADGELQDLMARRPGEDEDDLFNDSSEVLLKIN